MKRLLESKLTPRERYVLILVARGLTNQEISNQLRTNSSAVKLFLHQACIKLGARNRIEAVFFAIKQRIIRVDEIYSLDELAELLASLGPEAVETIAQLLRHRIEYERLKSPGKQILSAGRRQAAILTRRERDVLALVARGLSNQEIAEQLCTSTSTIRTFIYNACTKLEASNRAQAFISAIRQRAIDIYEVFSMGELVELLATLGPEPMETIAGLLRQRSEHELLPSGR